MEIRAEQPADRPAVRDLLVAAFGQPDEAELVERLRAAAQPWLALVAVGDGGILGQVMFTPVTLQGQPALPLMALAPLAVLPARQGQGIGTALVRAGLAACAAAGAHGVIVLGEPHYYSRFGFRPAASFGIGWRPGLPEGALMAAELQPAALADAVGTIRFHPAFDGLSMTAR